MNEMGVVRRQIHTGELIEKRWYHPRMTINRQEVVREKPKSVAIKRGSNKRGEN
jgi:hypothetical protein